MTPATLISDAEDRTLARALRTAGRLLARHAATLPVPASSVAPIALALPEAPGIDSLGIDVSDFDGAPVTGADAQVLLTAGPLYLAAQLESAGLGEAVDVLAGLHATGAFTLPRGAASHRLGDLWQRRHARFTSPERAALFARLFGDPAPAVLAGPAPVNTGFANRMVGLVEAITNDRIPGAAAVRPAVLEMAANLLPRLSGIPVIAAEELLDGVRDGLALFREPDLQAALLAHSGSAALATAVQRYVGARPSLATALARGEAGQVLLGWVATTAVGAAAAPVVPTPALDAAVNWARAVIAADAGAR